MVFLCFIGSLSAESNFEKLKGVYESKASELATAVQNLETQYKDHLTRQRQEAQAKGNLKMVLAIENELKEFGAAAEIAEFEALKKAQEVYIQKRSAYIAEQAVKHHALLAQYKTSLNSLQVELTKNNDIETAKVVLAEVERVDALIESVGGSAVPAATGDEVVLVPSNARNETPGDPNSGEGRRTYIVETDGTEGTLHLEFDGAKLKRSSIQSASLEFSIANTPSADTHNDLLVFVNDSEIGSKEGGAIHGEKVVIPLEVGKIPSDPKFELELRCGGTNAAVIQRSEPGPQLRILY